MSSSSKLRLPHLRSFAHSTDHIQLQISKLTKQPENATTKENFGCRPSGSSVDNECPENSLEIRKFPKFFLENFISFCFPCDQQNFPKNGNFLETRKELQRRGQENFWGACPPASRRTATVSDL